MKKIFSLFVIVLAVLVFSGCANQKKIEAPTPGESSSEVKKEGNGVISSIKDAMGLGKRMKCTYIAQDGKEKVESTIYVDGKKYMSVIDIAGKKTRSLFDGEMIYTWVDGEKVGTKIGLDCMGNFEDSVPANSADDKEEPAGVENPEDRFEDAMNVNCTPAEAVDFSLPADIKFTDQCEVMKKTMDAVKDMKLPAGIEMPTNLPNIPE